MINKYAEIRDRLALYNACKGILRVKMAEGMPAGAVSSMNANAGTGQQQQASGQPQKPMSQWEFSKMYGNAPIEDSWTDWFRFGGKASRQLAANNKEYTNYVNQMQAQNRQMLNQDQQPMQQQPMQQQQPAPQGVDPNQWQQFQRFQQLAQNMQKQWDNIQKNPLGTGLGMV